MSLVVLWMKMKREVEKSLDGACYGGERALLIITMSYGEISSCNSVDLGLDGLGEQLRKGFDDERAGHAPGLSRSLTRIKNGKGSVDGSEPENRTKVTSPPFDTMLLRTASSSRRQRCPTPASYLLCQ